MRILVLGGTQFIGRHIVEAAAAAGHTVSVLNRGRTPDALPASVERLRGDRDAGEEGLAALADRFWDACVDVCGYFPYQVHPSVKLLQNKAHRYIFVSAVRVYGDPTVRPVRETHPLLPPPPDGANELNNDTYGPFKVACEKIVSEYFGDRATMLRPQIVAGPYDPSGRYTYWVKRATLGGAMLAPGDGTDHLQIIDARDLARFAVRVVENDLAGSFNLAGPRITWAEFTQALGAKKVVWVGTVILQSQGINERELPLFRPERGPWSSLMDIRNEKALKAGLTLTDPEITVRDTRAWCQDLDIPLALPPAREAKLIKIACQE